MDSPILRRAAEAVEYGLRSGWRDRENRAVVVRAPFGGRAVERALDFDEAGLWVVRLSVGEPAKL